MLGLLSSTGLRLESFSSKWKLFQSKVASLLVLLEPIFLLGAVIYAVMIAVGPFLAANFATGAFFES